MVASGEGDEPVEDFPIPEKAAGKRPRSLYFLGGGLVLLTLMLALAY